MDDKLFLFHGDSFTWGEGLELQNPKTENLVRKIIEYRKSLPKVNVHDYSYYNYPAFMDIICDTHSKIHRLQNSFTHLISEHFGAIGIRNQNNGGTNILSLQKIEKLIDTYPKFDFVLLQLTNSLRDIENHPDDQSLIFSNTFGTYFNKEIEPKDYNNFIKAWELWDSTNKGYKKFNSDIEYFNKVFCNTGKLWDLDFAMKIQTEYKFSSEKIAEIYDFLYKRYCEYIDRIESKLKKKIYIIGSWCSADFYYNEKNSESEYFKKIKDRTIPLTIFKTETFNSIFELTETFYYENLYLDEMFPEFNNNHPTIKLNKVIADSVISYIKDNKLL